MKLVSRALTVACFLAPAGAFAENWVSAELPAAVAVSDAQMGVFRAGAMPAVGLYADNGWFALGARLRAGVLRNGAAPDNHTQDPGMGGLFTGGLAARVHKAGGWVELVGGGGITGTDLVPSVELGAGWTFPVGDYDFGPSARWVRVIDNQQTATLGSADLMVVGIDVRFGVDRKKKIGQAYVAKAPMPAPVRMVAAKPVVPTVAAERDHDVVFERREMSCAESSDGCPVTEHIQMFETAAETRLVLDERVLFDLNHAGVRTTGRAVIADIAKMWHAHPEWQRVTVEGHTDTRGTDELNQALSEKRAANAAQALEDFGFTAAQVEWVGYGRTRPRVEHARAEAQHHKNRRVEFVITKTENKQ